MATRQRLEKLAEVANAEHRTEEIEIDVLQREDELSIAPEGIWVRAWVFLSNDMLETHGLKNDG